MAGYGEVTSMKAVRHRQTTGMSSFALGCYKWIRRFLLTSFVLFYFLFSPAAFGFAFSIYLLEQQR
jgi:hypothetical protein